MSAEGENKQTGLSLQDFTRLSLEAYQQLGIDAPTPEVLAIAHAKLQSVKEPTLALNWARTVLNNPSLIPTQEQLLAGAAQYYGIKYFAEHPDTQSGVRGAYQSAIEGGELSRVAAQGFVYQHVEEIAQQAKSAPKEDK